jgi:hypothetical protein
MANRDEPRHLEENFPPKPDAQTDAFAVIPANKGSFSRYKLLVPDGYPIGWHRMPSAPCPKIFSRSTSDKDLTFPNRELPLDVKAWN